eukprot:5495742-Pyramimonas_sp.AAC.1
MLNGTGRVAMEDEDVTQVNLPNHTCVQFGFRNSRWSNRSCGLAVMFNAEMKGTLQQTLFPPRSRGIAGRIAMTKFRIGARTVAFFPFPVYLPPKDTTPS